MSFFDLIFLCHFFTKIGKEISWIVRTHPTFVCPLLMPSTACQTLLTLFLGTPCNIIKWLILFRAKGKSISRALTCVLIMVTVKLYLPMKYLIMDYGVFFCFSVLITLSVPLTFNKDLNCQKKTDDLLPSNWFYLPETSDKNLEQVHYLYTDKSTDKQDAFTNDIWFLGKGSF